MVREHTYRRETETDNAAQIRVMRKQIRALQKNVEELNAAVEDIFSVFAYMADEEDECEEECRCDTCEREHCDCEDTPVETEKEPRKPVIVRVTRKVRYS